MIKKTLSKFEIDSEDLREAKKEFYKKHGGPRSISFMDALLLIFIALKLSGNIDWNWFIVFTPAYLNIIRNLCLVFNYRNKTS